MDSFFVVSRVDQGDVSEFKADTDVKKSFEEFLNWLKAK